MRFVLLGGSSHPALSTEVGKALGVPLGRLTVERFPDGELNVELHDRVRGTPVFIVQSLHAPVGEHLIELALIADACRRSGAASVTAVIPYLGYARQDRRDRGREPLGARVLADMLGSAHIDRLVCMDLHSRAVEGCFPLPVEHASAITTLTAYLKTKLPDQAVVISPDLGAVKRAEAFATPLGLPVAVVHKQRLSGAEVRAHGVVGDVKGLHPVLVDDMISTGGTLAAAAQAVLEAGAKGPVTVVASHGLFVGPANERLGRVPLERVVVTDSVPAPTSTTFPLERVTCAPVLAEIIQRLLSPGNSP